MKSKKIISVILSAIMLLSSFVFPSFADDGQTLRENNVLPEDVTGFVVTSGLKYVSPEYRAGYSDAFLSYAENKGVQIEQLDGLFDSMQAEVNYLKVKGVKYLIVNSGLTLNGFSSDAYSLSRKLKQLESDTGVNVIVCPGPGDIYSSSALYFEDGKKKTGSPLTPAQMSNYFSSLGPDIADEMYTQKTSALGSFSYTVSLDSNYELIVIDASYYDSTLTANGGRNVSGKITDELMTWIKEKCAEAKKNGKTPIGVCGWKVTSSDLVSENNVVYDCCNVADELAKAGMEYIYTSATGRNDVSSKITSDGKIIYDIESSNLSSFPNTLRVNYLKSDGVTTDIVDSDDARAVVSRADSDGKQTVYDKPYRQTASLKITYANYDMARYFTDIFENFIKNDVITGTTQYGTFSKYIESEFGVNLESLINYYIGDGINLFGKVVIFDASNIVNQLDNDIFPQIEQIYLKDPEKLSDTVYSGLHKITDSIISDKKSTKYLDSYGFGSNEEGGTVNSLLLEGIVSSKMGNEDISDDEFISDVSKNLKSGELTEFLAGVIAAGLVKDILLDGIFSQIKVKPEYLLFLDDNEDSLGEDIENLVKWYLKIHNQDATVTGLINTVLADGFFSKYGKTTDEVIDYYLKDYFSGDTASADGKQIAKMASYYFEDSDPSEKSDYNVTIPLTEKAEVPEDVLNSLRPFNIEVTFGEDSKTEMNISWYTSTESSGTEIELYDNSSETFLGKHFIGAKGADAQTESILTSVTSYTVDLGIADLGAKYSYAQRHTVKLSGLKPGTAYYYRIGDSSTSAWSDTMKFTTSSDSGKFTFIQMSDTAGITEDQFSDTRETAAAVSELFPNASFLVHTGNFVSSGQDFEQWKNYSSAVSGLTSYMPTSPVVGAREYDTSGIYDNFLVDGMTVTTSKQNSDGTVTTEEKQRGYYSFDYNNAHFTVIDSTSLRIIGGLTTDERKWINDDISNSNADWKIVIVHNSPYTDGYSTQSRRYKNYLKSMNEIISGLDVDIVLSGDSSDTYYRTNPVRNGNVTDQAVISDEYDGRYYSAYVKPSGTVYASIGSSGNNSSDKHEIYDTSSLFSFTGKSINPDEPMFSSVTVDGSRLIYTAYTIDGTDVHIVDSFIIRKSGSSFIKGDVNGDGKINAADARLALRFSAKLETLSDFALASADVDGSGKVTASDARLILRYSAKLIDKF